VQFSGEGLQGGTQAPPLQIFPPPHPVLSGTPPQMPLLHAWHVPQFVPFGLFDSTQRSVPLEQSILPVVHFPPPQEAPSRQELQLPLLQTPPEHFVPLSSLWQLPPLQLWQVGHPGLPFVQQVSFDTQALPQIFSPDGQAPPHGSTLPTH
jgi:hypothetical protein